MPRSRRVCSVCHITATTEGEQNISMHSLPRDTALRKRWLEFCKRDDKYTWGKILVCSKHFTPNDLRQMSDRVILKKGSFPSLNPPQSPIRPSNSELQANSTSESSQ